MGVNLNVPELLYVLDNTPKEQCIMLAGKHGIGKSEILTEYYTKLGMRVVPLFLGQMSDAGDIIGLPDKDVTINKTVNMLPYWFPTDGKPIVLLLDELNRARPEILQVIMDLVLNKKIVGKSLPEGCVVISAVNDGDEYILTDLDPALVSRFNLYTFTPEVSDWIKWATEKGVSKYIISYIVNHSDMLDCNNENQVDGINKDKDRRAWVRVSKIIDKMKVDDNFVVDAKFKKLVCGIVGAKAGVSFYDFVKKENMLFPSDLLSDFESVKTKLTGYTLLDLMNLCSSLCSYINMTDPRKDKDLSSIFSKNLILFFKYLIHNGKKEIVAYFTSNYESMTYPNMSMFVASDVNLETYINKFIVDIEI